MIESVPRRQTQGAGAEGRQGDARGQAQSNDFLGRIGQHSSDIEVITTPPRVSVDGFQHYINQGGTELVTFTVSGYWNEAGVRVGKYTFRSFPLPGANRRTSASLCSPIRGICRQTPCRRCTCATPPARRRMAASGSRCSPRNSAREDLKHYRPGDDAAGEPDRSRRHRRPAVAIPARSTAICAARTIRRWPTCA